jgi:PTH1 family peptidyl-tRNA hydrolase
MNIIFGLGNIGEEYKNTRHNVGFMVIDSLAKKWGIPMKKVKYSALFGKGEVSVEDKNESIVLAKPLTYMNLSGKAVKPLSEFFMIPTSHIIVVHDDIDLMLGNIRIKQGGGDAGHKGIRSISNLIGPGYIRVRVGIGKPEEKNEVIDYVTSIFKKEEKSFINEAIKRASEAIEIIIFQGLRKAQGQFNQ